MGAKQTTVGRLVTGAPDEARRRILSAFERSFGKAADAADMLAVTRRALDGWVVQLGIESEVEQLRYDGRAWIKWSAAQHGKKPDDVKAFVRWLSERARVVKEGGSLDAWVASAKSERLSGREA